MAKTKSTRDIVTKASTSIREYALHCLWPYRHGLWLGQGTGKENLAEMIRNKREMFLIEFSLGVKRDEMRKLEEQAHKYGLCLYALRVIC